jgi:uncharacterized protein YggT (Ycf19 family)
VSLVDFILNLAGLLLWLSWQAIGITAATRPAALTLVSTLKRAEPNPPRRWAPLLLLLALLLGRGLVYWQVAPAAGSLGGVNLGAVRLRFETEGPGLMLLYSFVSFGKVLGCYYLWLLLFALANASVPDSDPMQRIVRIQLGWLGRLPGAFLAGVPLVLGALLWLLIHWPFQRLGLYAAVPTPETLWQQSLIFGLGTYLAWEYLIAGLFLAHMINSYVYVGNSPVWHYLALAGRNLLLPIRWLPLTFGRADFRPVAGMVLVLLGGYYGARWIRLWFVQPPF